jgi:hypothetical protein
MEPDHGFGAGALMKAVHVLRDQPESGIAAAPGCEDTVASVGVAL